jgi:capsular exopolysaccharide synthesis family protein
LGGIERRRSEIKISQLEFKQKLDALEKVNKEQGPKAAMQKIAMMGLHTKLNEGASEFDKQIAKLEVDRKRLLQQVGPKHPAVIELEEAITLWRDIYGRGAGFSANEGREDPPKVRNLNSAESYIEALKSEISDQEALLKVLENQFDLEQKQARELTNYEAQDDKLRYGITASRELLNGIVKRLSEINLVKDFGGYEAKSIAPPGYGRKVSPNPYSVFPIAALGGLLAGLALAYLAELSDKSFRNPAEIRRRLGLPVIGHIPYFQADEKAAKQIAAGELGIDPMICTHYASNSVSSEAYRSVRTALYFNTQGAGHQVIQVTSPNMADGKSTLAANLAVSIAQSGKKTIIIDADCRRPRVHKIFNIPHDTGLASVIAGQSDLASAIRPTSVPNLAALPCGPRPANPAELLTSPRFKELLDIIRAQYDFILLDTPPLLVVTDPCVVAPRVDGVVLAIRVTKNGRPFAERAKEILTSLGAHVVGVVVNGLGGQAGGRYGYGYDAYNYNYGYTYRYSYTYTDDYSDDKAMSYYQSPDDAELPPSPPPA